MTTGSNQFASVRLSRGATHHTFTLPMTLAGAALRRIGQLFQLVCQPAVIVVKSCCRIGNLSRCQRLSFVSPDAFDYLHSVPATPSSEARFLPVFSV